MEQVDNPLVRPMKQALLPLLAIALAACQSRPDSTASTQTAAQPDTLTYEIRTYEARSQRCVKPDSLCAVASFKYPLFSGDAFRALSDSLRADVISMAAAEGDPDLRARSLEEAAKNFTGTFDEAIAVASRDSIPFSQTWSLEIKTEVLRQTPTWVSVAHNFYVYSGGAHPNHATRYVNYDRATGHRLTLADLFQPDFEKTLTGIAERHFRQQEGLKPGQSLKEDYFFENGTFRLNDNFTLTATGLKFLYNPYEIKPYAAGETELEVPFSELEGILKKDAIR